MIIAHARRTVKISEIWGNERAGLVRIASISRFNPSTLLEQIKTLVKNPRLISIYLVRTFLSTGDLKIADECCVFFKTPLSPDQERVGKSGELIMLCEGKG